MSSNQKLITVIETAWVLMTDGHSCFGKVSEVEEWEDAQYEQTDPEERPPARESYRLIPVGSEVKFIEREVYKHPIYGSISYAYNVIEIDGNKYELSDYDADIVAEETPDTIALIETIKNWEVQIKELNDNIKTAREKIVYHKFETDESE